MPAQHLQPRALYEAIADRIRERILSHELPPGQDISEPELASAYGVCRTPVREALKRLHHEGLLSANNRRGMAVTHLSEAEIAQATALYQMLADFARQQPPAASDAPHPPLCTRMLMQVEQQLRLAYGPSFDSIKPFKPRDARQQTATRKAGN